MLLQTDRSLARHSWYAETASRRQDHRALQGEVRAEVAIVGGGLAGLSAALELAQRGRQVVLLEAQQLGWAASGRNGGQALGGLACGMDEIEAQLGLADARRLWAMTLEALTLIHARRDRYRIACDWQSGALTVATSARKAAALRRDAERMASAYDHPTQWLDRAALGLHIRSPRYHGGCYDRRGGHLHPLKYALGLADAAWREGARLHEHSPVQRVERHRSVTLLRTPQGQVVADQVLLAGNVHLPALAGVGALPPGTGARIMPVGTYVGVTEPLDPSEMDGLLPTRAAVCDSNFVLDYFRPTADQRLLFGGKVSYSTLTPPNLAGSLQARLARVFPRLAWRPLTHVWGGFVDITMNRAPDFSRLPPDGAAGAPIYLLQGFSGHGLALSGLAGKLVAEAICEDASRFDLFARLRHRPFPGGERLRTPTLVLGMLWHRLRDLTG
ncbi:gamma-glutamylputrescine oxidase [Sphaerotilus sulfidivorans]|jgi:gamma-glutamylputrescine oxidase|uniref:FAD-binding oxidoreductase n=1 Tax=Sphaerotilus sulfidivorans TaxID=639200 RepID=A0A5C1PYT3_9BURK|nr:FAD-binding oxidoreductase [Sphaerotilus sulfidivorans]NZD46719.1 FAD-binding oxidoreductase [Sphaerotilus sulfidivorans]QEN00983.1 FAD-binding oxidoreductase [Sphaerotilus sulfidivorans]GIX50941.1 oxidoreductase [Sphaerotilus natans]